LRQQFRRLVFLLNQFNKKGEDHLIFPFLLYKTILWAHRKLEIELPEEVYQQKLAFNYNSENLFAEDFINSSYYIQVPDKFNTNKTKELGKFQSIAHFDNSLHSKTDFDSVKYNLYTISHPSP
jgi:hypothetical protein